MTHYNDSSTVVSIWLQGFCAVMCFCYFGLPHYFYSEHTSMSCTVINSFDGVVRISIRADLILSGRWKSVRPLTVGVAVQLTLQFFQRGWQHLHGLIRAVQRLTPGERGETPVAGMLGGQRGGADRPPQISSSSWVSTFIQTGCKLISIPIVAEVVLLQLSETC